LGLFGSAKARKLSFACEGAKARDCMKLAAESTSEESSLAPSQATWR
jgi:hypothetical protein